MTTTTTDRRSGASTAGATVDRATAASTGAAYKAPCAAATTADITLSALQTIDGVALAADDRVLVKDQSTAAQNGIYIASSGDWVRAPDWDDSRDVVEGTRVWVTDGSVNGQSEFVVTSAGPISPGTTSVTIEESSSIAGGALLAANNLSDVASPIAAVDNLTVNGATIVANTTLDLDAATGDCVDVSGNTTITAVTLAAGSERRVRFTGTPQITVGASLIGNGGGSNITMAAGDVVVFRGYASSVVRFWVERLSGKPVVENYNGRQSMWIDAGVFVPQITNGPSAGIVELATTLQPLLTLDFDTTTQEFAVARWAPPKKWDAGTVTFQAYWTAASGTGTAGFLLEGVAISNDDALNTAYGTAVAVIDTLITANDLHISPESAAITIAGTPAEADLLWLRIKRDVATDTLAVDAKLIGIMLFYTTDAGNDA